MRGFESTAFRDPRSVRKTMTGSGMVEPTEDVTVTYESGRTETLKAGITRLSPNHELVRMRPGIFRPCDQEDKATATRMLELAGTHTRVLDRATRTDASDSRVSGRHQLRRKHRQPSKLR